MSNLIRTPRIIVDVNFRLIWFIVSLTDFWWVIKSIGQNFQQRTLFVFYDAFVFFFKGLLQPWFFVIFSKYIKLRSKLIYKKLWKLRYFHTSFSRLLAWILCWSWISLPFFLNAAQEWCDLCMLFSQFVSWLAEGW